MSTSTLTIKETYHDALFFATATINENKKFHLPLSELRVLEKLIHYSKKQENITWSSDNISKHIFTTPTAIDKIIQRLKKKGFINVSTTQVFEKVKSRTIFINWDILEKINQLALDYNKLIESEFKTDETFDKASTETFGSHEPIQLEPKEQIEDNEDKTDIIQRYDLLKVFTNYCKINDEINDERFDMMENLIDVAKKRFKTSTITLNQMQTLFNYINNIKEYDNELKSYLQAEITSLSLTEVTS